MKFKSPRGELNTNIAIILANIMILLFSIIAIITTSLLLLY